MKLTLPLLFVATVTPVTVITTYFLAVKHGHVHSHYPFVSDTFAYSPERAIAGIALNLLAFVLGSTFYFRYLQVIEYSEAFGIILMRRFNKAAFIIGINSAAGLLILANCQADGVLMFYHWIGSFGFYFGLMVYLIFESIISLLTPEHIVSRRLAFTRVCVATTNVLCMVIMVQQGACAVPQFTGHNDSWFFNPCRVVAAIMEWVILCLVLVFLGTYYREAETVTITLAMVKLEFEKANKVIRHFA